MQMAKTQKNKATSGHLGMLKVSLLLTGHDLISPIASLRPLAGGWRLHPDKHGLKAGSALAAEWSC